MNKIDHKKITYSDIINKLILDMAIPFFGVIFLEWSLLIAIGMYFIQIYVIGIVDFIFYIIYIFKEKKVKIFFKRFSLGFIETAAILFGISIIFLALITQILLNLDAVSKNFVDNSLYYQSPSFLAFTLLIPSILFLSLYVNNKIRSYKRDKTKDSKFMTKNLLFNSTLYIFGIYLGSFIIPLAYNRILKPEISFFPNISTMAYGLLIIFGVAFLDIIYTVFRDPLKNFMNYLSRFLEA